MSQRWDDASQVEEVVWNLRLSDLPRAENRTILLRLFNGDAPFDEADAERDAIQINRNNLSGANLLGQGRRQWNQAFLGTKNFFTVTLDSGPVRKRGEWAGIITKHINRRLKRNPGMREQIRATGANVMLHGIGPVNWSDRQSPVPKPLPVESVLIPSETDIDLENLKHIAIFREMTPAQLYKSVFGPKRDPGWNMDLVRAQWDYVRKEVMKQPNATAFQYMPERIEELGKQDVGGFWGSDAVPTIDYWDFLTRGDKGDGVYRRVILDWGVGASQMSRGMAMPTSRNKVDDKYGFLYTSGDRKYADDFSQVVHFQFGDCAAYAPAKVHSQRSLAWMLWGPCDLDNRLYCKFMEAAFMDMMWWFRVAGETALTRLKRADFFHFGVIPNGVQMVLANERFTPNANLMELAFQRNRQLMQENAASYIQDFGKSGTAQKEKTATEVMAEVNAVNALVGGMLALAYDYEEPKYREISRRFCLQHTRDKDAKAFQKACIAEGVPPDMLDVDRWEIEPERQVGGGNKTLQLAMVNYLNSIRKNLPPDGQRIVDHMSVFAATDQADLADQIVPQDVKTRITDSQRAAQYATDRLLRGLPFQITPDLVAEDLAQAWIADMAMEVQRIENSGGVGTPQDLVGLQNLAQHIGQALGEMTSDEDKERVKQYEHGLGVLMNHLKAFVQRQAQAAKARNGEQPGGVDPKVQSALLMAQVKAKNAETSHAQRTAQKQVSFELQEQRKDRETAAELRRKADEHALDMTANRLKSFQE